MQGGKSAEIESARLVLSTRLSYLFEAAEISLYALNVSIHSQEFILRMEASKKNLDGD